MSAARPIRNDPSDERSPRSAKSDGARGRKEPEGQGGPPGGGGLIRLTPLRELQLLEEYRAGGPQAADALTQLLEGYQRRIYSICYRIVPRPEDAADLTQDVLAKMVEHLQGFVGRSKLSTWVIRVAMNAALTHARKRKLRDHQSLDSGRGQRPLGGDPKGPSPGSSDSRPTASAALEGGEPLPLEHVEQAQRRRLVTRALESIDPETRSLLVLRDVQDLDYQQLAEVFEVPVGTVKSRLFRARAAFREAIEASEGI